MNDGIYNSIDADTLVYLVAYKFRESDDTEGALQELDNYVRTILDNTATTYYAGFLGGEKCFRYQVAKTKPYKGNRPPSPDWYKKWSGPMKAYLRDEWNFQIVNGIEADDAVCIYQHWCLSNNKNSIMSHGDKDLYQIEGNHYDIRKHTRKYVTEIEGYYNLYTQVLTGDASDAIVGLPQCGKVGAGRVLNDLHNIHAIHIAVTNKYYEHYNDVEKALEQFSEMYTLCRLLTHSETLPVVWSTYTPKSVTEEPEIDLTGLIWD